MTSSRNFTSEIEESWGFRVGEIYQDSDGDEHRLVYKVLKSSDGYHAQKVLILHASSDSIRPGQIMDGFIYLPSTKKVDPLVKLVYDGFLEGSVDCA